MGQAVRAMNMAEPGLMARAKKALQWGRRWARARAYARGRGGSGCWRRQRLRETRQVGAHSCCGSGEEGEERVK